MSIKIEVHGEKKLQAFLRSQPDIIRQAHHQGLKKAAAFMEGEVKESIAGNRNEGPFFIKYKRQTGEGPGMVRGSRNTGHFWRSISHVVPSPFQAMIFSGVGYDNVLEFGNSKGRAPRRHFTNSLNRNIPLVRKIVTRAIAERVGKGVASRMVSGLKGSVRK